MDDQDQDMWVAEMVQAAAAAAPGAAQPNQLTDDEWEQLMRDAAAHATSRDMFLWPDEYESGLIRPYLERLNPGETRRRLPHARKDVYFFWSMSMIVRTEARDPWSLGTSAGMAEFLHLLRQSHVDTVLANNRQIASIHELQPVPTAEEEKRVFGRINRGMTVLLLRYAVDRCRVMQSLYTPVVAFLQDHLAAFDEPVLQMMRAMQRVGLASNTRQWNRGLPAPSTHPEVAAADEVLGLPRAVSSRYMERMRTMHELAQPSHARSVAESPGSSFEAAQNRMHRIINNADAYSRRQRGEEMERLHAELTAAGGSARGLAMLTSHIAHAGRDRPSATRRNMRGVLASIGYL